MRLPLKGITVVSVEQAVAAPFCTSRLADAGARVIKIERPEGDFARTYDRVAKGQSAYFVWLNRGKESVILDLADPSARDRLSALIAEADVFVQNLKLGALARLGFAVPELRRRHPRLITCSITGYGESGPYRNRKAYDLLIQAESGLASITGGPDAPARVGVSIVDIATGAAAHTAVLEALIGRGVTGEGSAITVSMFDVMADWLTVPLLQQEAGSPPMRIGLAHTSIAPYGVFTTSEGKPILIAIQNDREWLKLCTEVLRRPEAATDPRFSTNLERVRNRVATDELVGAAFRRAAMAELIERLTKADIAFAEVHDMEGLSRHPHLRRVSVSTPNGEVDLPAPGAIFDGEERKLGAVPALGEGKV